MFNFYLFLMKILIQVWNIFLKIDNIVKINSIMYTQMFYSQRRFRLIIVQLDKIHYYSISRYFKIIFVHRIEPHIYFQVTQVIQVTYCHIEVFLIIIYLKNQFKRVCPFRYLKCYLGQVLTKHSTIKENLHCGCFISLFVVGDQVILTPGLFLYTRH